MKRSVFIQLRRVLMLAAFCVLFPALVPCPSGAEELTFAFLPPRIAAFKPGESLTYDVSWSRIVTAGVAVMEVKGEVAGKRPLLRFVATGRSKGVVDTFYPVNDAVQSVFDPLIMQSLSYDLNQSHGKRTKRRDLVFDHLRKTLTSTFNDEPPKTVGVPDPVQDPLSALYYLRTKGDFAAGSVVTIDLHDGNKNWSMEVHTLGREKVRTPAGEFDAIKIVAYPRSGGVFMHKGDILLWLTDDIRRVPVLMKCRIALGSLVMTLTKMKPGDDAR
jgi:hypothetical protein